MSNVAIFNFESKAIRSVLIEGEPWFVGKDVAASLGYSNETDAMNTHCRGVAKRYPILDSLGRTQEARILSEPDVLRLIIGSKLPAAQAFEAWVFEEVLPSIRKTGKYAVPEQQPQPQPVKLYANPATQELANQLDVFALMGVPLHLAQVEAVKEVRLTLGVDYSNALKLAPAQQNIQREEEALEPTDLGKSIGLKPIQMNRALEAAGLQVKAAEGWMPTEAGAPFASRHQWSVGGKSGYNWKWKRGVLKLITPN